MTEISLKRTSRYVFSCKVVKVHYDFNNKSWKVSSPCIKILHVQICRCYTDGLLSCYRSGNWGFDCHCWPKATQLVSGFSVWNPWSYPFAEIPWKRWSLVENKNDPQVTSGINMGHTLRKCWIQIQNSPILSMDPLDHEFTKGIQAPILTDAHADQWTQQMEVIWETAPLWNWRHRETAHLHPQHVYLVPRAFLPMSSHSTGHMAICEAHWITVTSGSMPLESEPGFHATLFCLSVSGTFSLLW